jgi:hypothetical protein
MRRVVLVLLFATFAFAGLASRNAVAAGQDKPAAGAKEARWHGKVVRSNKDMSTLDVRRGTITKTVHYDSSTKWTKAGKAIEAGDVKDGDDVIVLGNYNEKKELVATQIDLRTPKGL